MGDRNLPLGAMVFMLVGAFLKLKGVDGKADRPACGVKQFLFRLDIGGSILLIVAVSCLFMAMQWGGLSMPWSSPTVIGLFSTSAVLFVFFLILEWAMGDGASVPFLVLKQRSIASAAVYLFFCAMPNFSVSTHQPNCQRKYTELASTVCLYPCSSRPSRVSVRKEVAQSFFS